MPTRPFDEHVLEYLADEKEKIGGPVYIAIVPTDTRDVLRVALGADPAQITEGYGGYEDIERDGDKPITSWAGDPLLKLTIPLYFDGFPRNRGVQKRFDRLMALGRSEDSDEPPSPFMIFGPIPFGSEAERHRWVFDGQPEMGASIRVGPDGQLQRQFLTLNVKEYVPPDRIRIRKKKRKGKKHTYETKKGDTLLKVAAKFKKDHVRDYAREIGKKNDIRDIRKILDPGTKLRLP